MVTLVMNVLIEQLDDKTGLGCIQIHLLLRDFLLVQITVISIYRLLLLPLPLGGLLFRFQPNWNHYEDVHSIVKKQWSLQVSGSLMFRFAQRIKAIKRISSDGALLNLPTIGFR